MMVTGGKPMVETTGRARFFRSSLNPRELDVLYRIRTFIGKRLEDWLIIGALGRVDFLITLRPKLEEERRRNEMLP